MSKVLDSSDIALQVAEGGTLRFYLRTLIADPGKILVGVVESLAEIFRFIFHPRFQLRLTMGQRLSLIGRWARAEMRIPGGTTVLEMIWLAYGASRAASPARNWIEVGCFKGLSTVRLSMLCAHWDRNLYACDTFSGLPGSDAVYDAVDSGVSYHFKAGSYAGLEQDVRDHLKAYGEPERVTTLKGNVRDTLPAADIGAIGFGFLDVDLVESYKNCFSGIAQRLEKGSMIAIHEACYRPIRNLVEDQDFWRGIGLSSPTIEYVAETYGIRSCRNLAFLSW